MKSLFKTTKFISDIKYRRNYSLNEIFFYTTNILKQSNFSNNISSYFFTSRKNFIFLSKIRNRCIFTGGSRTVKSKYKISRHAFLRKITSGGLVGFYKSVW